MARLNEKKKKKKLIESYLVFLTERKTTRRPISMVIDGDHFFRSRHSAPTMLDHILPSKKLITAAEKEGGRLQPQTSHDEKQLSRAETFCPHLKPFDNTEK